VKDEAAPPILQRDDRPLGVALAEMQKDVRETWRTRCAIQGDAEQRALALLNCAESFVAWKIYNLINHVSYVRNTSWVQSGMNCSELGEFPRLLRVLISFASPIPSSKSKASH
jgi:hypothetical protein